MQDVDQSRLKWQCRRGLLELDILLGEFLDKCYPGLAEAQQSQFQQLLNCHDQDILAWLMGYLVPPEPNLKEIVEIIRNSLK